MTKQKLPPGLQKLSVPIRHADKVEKIVTAVSLGLANAFLPLPAGPALSTVQALFRIRQDEKIKKLREILVDELRKGNVDPSDERLQSVFPMAHKLAEASKQGEYERNLRILAAFLRGELQQEVPDASNFARMARRIEFLSPTDLKVMVLVDAFVKDVKARTAQDASAEQLPFISATALSSSPLNKHQLSKVEIQESLVDLVSRGFLMAHGAPTSGKIEEYYFPTSNLKALIDRAGTRIEERD
jgi:hypothetical protein